MPQWRLKIPSATTKTRHSQTNKQKKFLSGIVMKHVSLFFILSSKSRVYFHFHTSQFILTPFQLLGAYFNPNMARGYLTGRCKPKLLTPWRQEPCLLFLVIISSEPITVSRMYGVTGIPRIYAEYWINEPVPPAVEAQSLNCWTTREVRSSGYLVLLDIDPVIT